MTTIETHADAFAAPGRTATQSSLLSTVTVWVTSTDYKKLGRLMAGMSLVCALIVGVVGAFLGLERMDPASYDFVHGDAVAQLLAYFRFALTFRVLIPVLLGLALAVVPSLVGAKSVAYARATQFGVWTWIFGSILSVISILGNGGPGGGTTDLVDLYLLGFALTAFGLCVVATTVASTVLTARKANMPLWNTPAFAWSALVGSASLVLTLPVAIGTSIYLYVDHTHARAVFGGNTGINKWLGWIFTQPTTLIAAVFVVGLLVEIAPTAFGEKTPMRNVVYSGIALVSAGMLTGITQTQHVLALNGNTTDKIQTLVLFAIFHLLPGLGIVIVLGLVAYSAKSGSVNATGAFSGALLGGLAVLIAAAANAVQHIDSVNVMGTSFEEGTHLLLVYGAVAAAIGGIAHFFPLWTGKKLDDKATLVTAGGVFLGALLAGAPLLVAGLAGQPINAVAKFDYDGPGSLYNTLSAAGHVIVVLTVVAFIGAALKSAKSGESAKENNA